MAAGDTYINKSLPRVDGESKTLGQTKYITDIEIEGMAHAYPVCASVPFGKVKSVNYSKLSEDPDFITLVSASDIPGQNQVGVIIQDQPLFADETVRFVGDVIALVVAETHRSAVRLAKLVEVEYEKQEPLFSISSSQNSSSNFIHETNIACSHRVQKGDIDKGFAEADYIMEEQFSTPFQEHYYLEPQGCIAISESDGSFTIRGSLQCIYYVQKAVARVMGVEASLVRVIQSPTGGAFGGKEDIPSEICARAVLAAKICNRPIKVIYEREDDFQLTSKRHPFEMKYKIGVMNNGKILAAKVELNENAGAYATLSSVVSYRSSIQALGPYVIPNVEVESTSWYTNLPPTGAFRGFGSPQATFGHERMMSIVADKLAIDPIDFRLTNIIEPGDETITGHTLNHSVGIKETILEAQYKSNWTAEKQNKESERYLTGVGVASSIYGNCLGAAGWHLDGAGVNIQINRDGSIGVAYGLIEMGQGADTVITQMVAEALSVSPARVHIRPTDTASIPDSGPSVASRNVVMTGNAIQDAASKINPVVLDAAAKMMNCASSDILIEEDLIKNLVTGETVVFDKLTEFMHMNKYQVVAHGWWHVPELSFDHASGIGEAYFTYSYATHIAKVKIDKLTGLVQVEKIWAAHDVGKAMNPAGIEGQIEGGTLQGLGWALTENFQLDNGHVTSTNLSTYLVPTAMDIPDVETLIVESPDPEGPWGAKGVGEPAIIPTAAAIANAVSNATGRHFNKLPIIPESVLRELSNPKGV